MRLAPLCWFGVCVGLVTACAHQADKHTLASLHDVHADTAEAPVSQGLDKAMQSYEQFLQHSPDSQLTPEAMRRLADLKIEKEYGIQGDGKLLDVPPPKLIAQVRVPAPHLPGKIDERSAERGRRAAIGAVLPLDSASDLEKRAAAQGAIPSRDPSAPVTLPEGVDRNLERAGPLEAIKLYDELLTKYPSYQFRDQVLYQKARAYDELGRTDEAMQVMEQLVGEDTHSRYFDEVQFRRAEHFFIRRKFRDAEHAYGAIVAKGRGSEYYELALYKLGWSLYKQEFYDEALRQYFALLDYKVATGYDFDAKHGEPEQRRVEDTFQVISLSFSYLGGPEVIGEYFSTNGHRGYEDRVYRYFGEFYLTKLRYQDAATVYKGFVALYPFHAAAPGFSMRAIEIYEKGGFPKLVLDSKKEFASQYGLHAEYWSHFDVNKSPQVLSYLKSNLQDLANHYHAQYQDAKQAAQKPVNYGEALHWYREFLSSFHEDPQAPVLNYQLADLMLENRDYAPAAAEYEHTAYDYPTHPQSSAAGYAAIYAHREYLKVASADAKAGARRDTINSSLKFADTFPEHDQAAVVLGAAAEDLYDMKDFTPARDAARKLLERFPNAAVPVRRSAWLVVAHSSFDLAQYADAEQAYTHVLEETAKDDAARAGLVDDLAASIYKQGEQANQANDFRTAANHFLRVKQVAPTSKISASAQYDAGAALIRLEDWAAAAAVLDEFRRAYPQHELQKEATKQIAMAYEKSGQLSQSAAEYDRVAAESQNPELRAEAMLQAGDLYQQSKSTDRALDVYSRYIAQFPKPLETAVETRAKIAAIYKEKNEQAQYQHQLEEIVRLDAAGGAERTGRTRNVAAHAALVLTEQTFARFAALKLTQPFERSLQEKQRNMDLAMKAFGKLVGYEVGEVTAAATFYMAEIYTNFSQSLRESERPPGLSGAALKGYEDQLDEEAFPFEEKAIGVHEKNLELMRRGVYDSWIEKSLARLAVLKPGRYAKSEVSSGFVGLLDRYVYRQPERSASSASPALTANQGEANVAAH
jgi:outer membrane protein assembly factor BamD (BamD/ComL family)